MTMSEFFQTAFQLTALLTRTANDLKCGFKVSFFHKLIIFIYEKQNKKTNVSHIIHNNVLLPAIVQNLETFRNLE